jgi:hypothetical protein
VAKLDLFSWLDGRSPVRAADLERILHTNPTHRDGSANGLPRVAMVRRNLPRCPLSNSRVWSTPGGERRQQPNGRQDHRNQDHEGQ